MSVSDELGSALRAKGLTIAVAESCTGGKLGDMLTSVPGSSDYFLGGVISYSNSAKVNILRVDTEILRTDGAVSQRTALQMAEGARKCFDSDIGLSTTGVAGPGGGSSQKPVGLVFVAVSAKAGNRCMEFRFSGAREDIKRQSAEAALALARDFLADLG